MSDGTRRASARNIDGEIIGVRYDLQCIKIALAEALVDKNQDIIVYFPGRSEIYLWKKKNARGLPNLPVCSVTRSRYSY
jgi:hypothetical protein